MDDSGAAFPWGVCEHGLTKREKVAETILGHLAGATYIATGDVAHAVSVAHRTCLSQHAVALADALLAKLNEREVEDVE